MRRVLGIVCALWLGACGENKDEGADTSLPQPDVSDGSDVSDGDSDSDSSGEDSSSEDTAGDSSEGDVNDCSDAVCHDMYCLWGSYIEPGECCPTCLEAPEGQACESADDCVMCLYPEAPRFEEECACTTCAVYPMTAARCEFNRQAWEIVCSDFAAQNPCPLPPCQQERAVCDQGSCNSLRLMCEQITCEDLGECQDIRWDPDTECCPTCADAPSEPAQDSCTTEAQCGFCAFPTFIEDPSQCHCVGCATTPLSKEACEANQASHQTHCSTFLEQTPCPMPMCVPSAAPICQEERCQANPNSCLDSSECMLCPYNELIGSADACACPSLAPTSRAHCAEREHSFFEYCADFDVSACSGGSSALIAPAVCGPDFVCAYP